MLLCMNVYTVKELIECCNLLDCLFYYVILTLPCIVICVESINAFHLILGNSLGFMVAHQEVFLSRGHGSKLHLVSCSLGAVVRVAYAMLRQLASGEERGIGARQTAVRHEYVYQAVCRGLGQLVLYVTEPRHAHVQVGLAKHC